MSFHVQITLYAHKSQTLQFKRPRRIDVSGIGGVRHIIQFQYSAVDLKILGCMRDVVEFTGPRNFNMRTSDSVNISFPLKNEIRSIPNFDI